MRHHHTGFRLDCPFVIKFRRLITVCVGWKGVKKCQLMSAHADITQLSTHTQRLFMLQGGVVSARHPQEL